MKIVLSPSKTKTITNATSNDGAVHTAVRDGQFQLHITQDIVKHVQSLDVAVLGKALKLKDDILYYYCTGKYEISYNIKDGFTDFLTYGNYESLDTLKYLEIIKMLSNLVNTLF